MIIDLPFFKQLDSESLAHYYEVDVNVEQNGFQVDINFEETSIDLDSLLVLQDYLNDLPGIIGIAKEAIAKDFIEGEDVKEFLTFHIEECDAEDMDTLVKDADKALPLDQQILSGIKLRRIGFYPYSHDGFAILDFVLDEEISQYILVVVINNSKAVDHITMES